MAAHHAPELPASGPQGDPTVRSEHVAGPIHVLFGAGGNVAASIGDDGVLLVDDKFAFNEGPIREELKALGGGRVAFVVNTHWHGDHTGANAAFGKEAVIVAHANVRARMAALEGVKGRTNDPPSPAVALPIVTHRKGMSIYFNGEEIRLFSFDHGHTDGDTVVWFTKSNVVHMGDLYFEVGYPFVDLDSGGGVQGLVESVEGVLARIPSDAKVISGHGKVTGTHEVREYLEMLKTIVGRVREAQALGETPKEMVAHGISEDFDERWGQFDFVKPLDFVTMVQRSLEEGR